jgi:adenosylcobinamide kinase/adenosylcobinamide-phosphate guanylyltransferase
MKTLILGGMKSGKSRYAETLATDSGLPVTVIATATAEDDAMRQRIARHRMNRPAHWTVVEEPIALARTLGDHAAEHHCIIVDCLTLWLTNLLCQTDAAALGRECDALLQLLEELPGLILLVSNEVNMGIIPLGELNRRFCDEAGRLHQNLARRCERVVLLVAGLPLALKG